MDRGYSNYRVQFYDNNIYDIDKKDIIRHLTPDEIEFFKSMKISKKFNI